MRRLAGVGLVVSLLLTACGSTSPTREATLLRDASECEADADRQLQGLDQADNTVRILFFQSCMMLRGWPGR
jgi:outer membrane biogenesis lipoprotein LolB